jgi:hypothetical protein
MRSSVERHIEGIVIDVNDLPWDVLMRSGDGAFGTALRVRRATVDPAAAGAGGAAVGTASVFANYAAPD